MNDPHHTWNTSKVIRCKKQICGCHIKPKTAKTDEIFNLCMEGAGYKKAVDEMYKLHLINKDTKVDETIKRNARERFEDAREWYLRHLATGKTWVL